MKNVIGPSEGPKMVFNLESVLRPGLLEGPKSALIINGNLKSSNNNHENCFYLDLYLQRSKIDINSLLVVTIHT